MTAQAVGIAEKALEGREGLATALGAKLEAAGMSIKPAEWLLTHAAIAFMAGLVALSDQLRQHPVHPGRAVPRAASSPGPTSRSSAAGG